MKKLLLAAAASLAAAGAHGAEADGAQLFANHCAACHGQRGEGDGPIAPLLKVTVPNLRELQKRAGGRFPADAVAAYVDGRTPEAAHGARAMPVWGEVFRAATADDEPVVAARVAVLVSFIAELQSR